jgi:uncharacterized RDD family membrane protein YckC
MQPSHTDQTDIVGRRIGALFIDSLLFAVVFVLMGAATGGNSSSDNSASVRLGGPAFFLFVAITLVYFFVCEGTTGQTLGKRLLGIRVVSEDGSRASWGQVGARTALRLVDSLPAFYIVGLITVLATGRGRRQRIGDIGAHTRVVPA